jgi:hypothetical protein
MVRKIKSKKMERMTISGKGSEAGVWEYLIASACVL